MKKTQLRAVTVLSFENTMMKNMVAEFKRGRSSREKTAFLAREVVATVF